MNRGEKLERLADEVILADALALTARTPSEPAPVIWSDAELAAGWGDDGVVGYRQDLEDFA